MIAKGKRVDGGEAMEEGGGREGFVGEVAMTEEGGLLEVVMGVEVARGELVCISMMARSGGAVGEEDGVEGVRDNVEGGDGIQ